MAVRSLKLLGGGQSEVQVGTLLMMMKGHISLKRKRAPARKKGTFTGVGTGGGARGHVPPPLFRGGGGQRYVCDPPLSDPEFRPRHRPTDICDVTLAWLASRCWARQMCPPPHTHTFCHVPTPFTFSSRLPGVSDISSNYQEGSGLILPKTKWLTGPRTTPTAPGSMRSGSTFFFFFFFI